MSHLPQLIAGALMCAAGEGCGTDGLQLAGRAFRERDRKVLVETAHGFEEARQMHAGCEEEKR